MLQIPAGPAGRYRWAQADDYTRRQRRAFLWQAPVALHLRARVSAPDLAGTWGFGLWNDPFALSLGLQGTARRLPALPNAAWFFFAGGPNFLTLRDDRPASGLLAAVFSSPRLPSGLLAPALPAAALLAFRPAARLLRRVARGWVRDEPQQLTLDITAWHTYSIKIQAGLSRFCVDEQVVFETALIPRGRLGLVIWIDNQFMRWDPQGRVQMGTLTGAAAVLEVAGVACAETG